MRAAARATAGTLLGVAVAVALLVVGTVLVVLGLRADTDPASVTRGYFAALADGDAPTALAYGNVPDGSRTLLTSTVLREQLRSAPLRDVRVDDVRVHGGSAQVRARYVLAFAGGAQRVTSTVTLTHRSGSWRLVSSAVATQLRFDVAQDRVVQQGALPADGVSLIFPGALPVRFDTSLLALDPSLDHVELGAASETDVAVVASAAGRTAARTAVSSALATCLSGHGSITCPLPTQRYVPGSLRGRVMPGATFRVSVSGSVGVLQVSGLVTVDGSYRRLTFANQVETKRGHLPLPVVARAYASTPLHVVWSES